MLPLSATTNDAGCSRLFTEREVNADILPTLSIVCCSSVSRATWNAAWMRSGSFSRDCAIALLLGSRWRKLAQRKLKEVDAKILRAGQLKSLLENLSKCNCGSVQVCVERLSLSLALAQFSAGHEPRVSRAACCGDKTRTESGQLAVSFLQNARGSGA